MTDTLSAQARALVNKDPWTPEDLLAAQIGLVAMADALERAERDIAEYRSFQKNAENLDALQGEVAKALNLSPEQAEVAGKALAKANASLLYWRDLAELAIAVHKDDEKRVALLRAALEGLLDAPEGDGAAALEAATTALRETAL